MKIAYLLQWNGGPETGVFKKVIEQVRTWKDYGHETGVFILSRLKESKAIWTDYLKDTPIFTRVYSSRRFGIKGFIERVQQANTLIDDLVNWQPDLTYYRYHLYWLGFYKLNSIPLCIEINTDDLKEYKCWPFFHRWYNHLTRSRLLGMSKGMVFVTTELANKPHFKRYHKPCAVIGNGIALEEYPVLPAPHNPRPRLVFIGKSGHKWHGIDKITWMAKRFPNWDFELIGTNKLDIVNDLPGNVSAYGSMERPEYENIMRHADIAIGTLSLHTKGMEEASPLKVREYLAYGIPTIIGYSDTDFPEGSPYLLQIPNTPDNVKENIERIEGFVETYKGRRVPREVVAHLDVKEKEKKRLAFFENLMTHR